MRSPNTPRMRPPSGEHPHGWAASRAVSAQKRADELRRRAGAAYRRLNGTVEEQARTIGLHHSQVVRRRQGQAGFANTLLEADQLERDGYDSTPLFEAWLETVLEARAARAGSLAAVAIDLSRQEQRRDGEEDMAQLAYHDDPRRGARGYLTGLLHYLGVALPLAMALKRETAP